MMSWGAGEGVQLLTNGGNKFYPFRNVFFFSSSILSFEEISFPIVRGRYDKHEEIFKKEKL